MQPSYHLSLSRVVPVRYAHIQPLLASLKEHLAKTERYGRPQCILRVGSMPSMHMNHIRWQVCIVQCSRLDGGLFRVGLLSLSITSPAADMIDLREQVELRYGALLWRFTISFGQLETFENDEGTRSFMSLLVDQGCKQVSMVLTCPLALAK